MVHQNYAPLSALDNTLLDLERTNTPMHVLDGGLRHRSSARSRPRRAGIRRQVAGGAATLRGTGVKKVMPTTVVLAG